MTSREIQSVKFDTDQNIYEGYNALLCLHLVGPFEKEALKVLKVCLINPPLYMHLDEINPPLGLAYIASYVERFGYDCDIIDANALRKDITSLVTEVAGKCDIIGISVVTMSVPKVVGFTDKLKARDPSVKVILGGIHPTVAPDSLLKACPSADALVVGEGEETFLDILRTYDSDHALFDNKEKLSTIKGIAFRDISGTTVISESRRYINNLDSIPFPAFHKLPMEKYRASISGYIGTKGGMTGFIITSRGCPYQCTFCASPALWTKFRYRSAANVKEEIQFLLDTYHVKQIEFFDDTLTTFSSRLEEICDFFISRDLQIKWHALARVSDIQDIKLAMKMRKSGCFELKFGIESGDPEVLKATKKKIDIEDIRRAIEICNKAGIKTVGYFILGLPGETKETALRTIAFARELDLDLAAFFILTPYPGSEIYNNLIKNGRIKEEFAAAFAENISVFRYPVLSVSSLNIDELFELRSYAIMQFYFSRKFLMKSLKRIAESPTNIFPLLRLFKSLHYLLPRLLVGLAKYLYKGGSNKITPYREGSVVSSDGPQ